MMWEVGFSAADEVIRFGEGSIEIGEESIGFGEDVFLDSEIGGLFGS